MENSENILKQLKIIKWMLIVISVCFVLTAGSISTFLFIISHSVSENQEKIFSDADDFSNKASDLIDENKVDEAIKLANEQLKNHSNDENGYWYRGKAYYLQKMATCDR